MNIIEPNGRRPSIQMLEFIAIYLFGMFLMGLPFIILEKLGQYFHRHPWFF